MKRLSKMIFTLVPCFTLIFVTGTSQGSVVPLTWSGTVTANAQAGDVYQSDTEPYSAHAWANYMHMPPIPDREGIAVADVSVGDGETAFIYARLSSMDSMTNFSGNASFSIAGAFTIGSSPEFPVGTPLDLTLFGQNSSSMAMGGFQNQLFRNGNLIWGEYGGLFTDSCQVVAGETLILNSSGWMTMIGSSSFQQQIVLEVTPEPATLLLLGLGGLILRRRK